MIRRNNVGEADRIVTLLTPEGKRALVVRGVRKITSKKAGNFELFHVVRVLLHETNGLPIAQEVEITAIFPGLRDNFQAATQAFWAAELVDKLVEDGEGGHLYNGLLQYIARVEAGATILDVLAFELAILEQLGWQPQLQHCAHCDHKLEPGRLGWSHKIGGVIDTDCLTKFGFDQEISETAVKALRVLATGQLDVSRRLRLSEVVQTELHEILHSYLESIAERHWQSPALMESAKLALTG